MVVERRDDRLHFLPRLFALQRHLCAHAVRPVPAPLPPSPLRYAHTPCARSPRWPSCARACLRALPRPSPTHPLPPVSAQWHSRTQRRTSARRCSGTRPAAGKGGAAGRARTLAAITAARADRAQVEQRGLELRTPTAHAWLGACLAWPCAEEAIGAASLAGLRRQRQRTADGMRDRRSERRSTAAQGLFVYLLAWKAIVSIESTRAFSAADSAAATALLLARASAPSGRTSASPTAEADGAESAARARCSASACAATDAYSCAFGCNHRFGAAARTLISTGEVLWPAWHSGGGSDSPR